MSEQSRRKPARSTSTRLGARTVAAVALGVASVGVTGTVSSQAAETVLYVDRSSSSCSDTGPGSATTPFCTIDRAASVATAGQTVQVASGTYTEEVVVDSSGTATAPIVFQPAPGATVTVGGRAHAFTVVGRSHVEIRGFRVADTTDDGVSVRGSSRITFSGNEVTGSGAPNSTEKSVGIYLESTTDSVVSGNHVHHNSDRGIYLNASTSNTISGNTAHHNAREYQREAAGIHLYRSNSNTVLGNVTYANEDTGINIYTASTDNLVVNNVSYSNGDHGIDVMSSTGTRVIGNSAYKNLTAGLNCEGGSTGTTFANNIAVDNGIASPRTHGNIRVDSSSTPGSSMNDDLMYLSQIDVMAIWNSVSYSSVAALRSATGQESRGLQGDPKWRDPGAGDFHLTAGSPAIDSANSGASGQTTVDLEGTARTDDPGTANTGVGTRAYDDRGAYEFVPGSTTNNPPNAVDDSTTTAPGTPVTVAVLANDTDPDGDTLTVSSATTPAHGTAAVNGDGTITYTPTTGYTGPDQFSYTAGDGRGGSDTASVSVTVSPDSTPNTPPVAADDQASTVAGTPVTVNVLGNDTDADGDALTVSSATTPAHGTATVNATGTITYSPTTGYTGPDQFTYTVSDGRGGTDTAAVAVIVTDPGPEPGTNVVGNPGFETSTTGWNTSGSGNGVVLSRVTGGHSGSWSGLVANLNSNRRNCFLNDATNWVSSTGVGTYTASMWVRGATSGATFTLRLREYSSGGALLGTQTASTTLSTTWQEVSLTYAPASPTSSLDLNGYRSQTPTGTCFYADDVSLTRTAPPPPANTPPVATDDQATTQAGTAVTVDVLANDTDADSDPLTVGSATTPAHGSATVNANGSITYTPAAGYTGADQFDYTVSDGRGGTDTGTVAVTVSPTDPPPDPNLVGNPGFETGTTGWNTAGSDAGVTLTRVAGGHTGDWAGQLANTGTANAACTLNDAPNWVNGTSAGTYTTTVWARAETAGAVLRLRIREYAGTTLAGVQTSTATLTTEWQQVTVTYSPTTPGSTLDLNAYTLNTPPGTCFTIDDITMTWSSAVPVNQAPVAVDDQATTQQDTAVTVNVLGNDTDADGDPLTTTSAGTPGNGTAAVNGNGSVTYTPAAGYSGADAFTYTVSDGRGGTDTATVSVTVNPVQANPNLVGNPGFETGTTGWNTSGSGAGVTLSRVAGGHTGDWAAQLTNTSATSTTCALNDSPSWVSSTTAGTYTASIWVRADTAGTSFRLRFREYAGSTLAGQQTTTTTLTTGWQQVTVTYTITTPGSSLDLNAYSSATPPGTCFYADDVSLTKG